MEQPVIRADEEGEPGEKYLECDGDGEQPCERHETDPGHPPIGAVSHQDSPSVRESRTLVSA